MAQDPFKVDQIQIEPGTTGTRLIRRKISDNSLEFTDGVAGAFSLKQLAGFNLDHLLIVGTGAGSQYTTIQGAINAIPVGTDPYTVLVGPGTYAETVTIQRSGINLIGLGYPTVTQSVGHTLLVQTGGGSTPYQVTVQGIDFTNSDVSSACVRLLGGASSDVGRDGIELLDCNLNHASGGGYALWATSICKVSSQRCSFNGNDAIAIISNCGEAIFCNVDGLAGFEFLFDITGTLPSLTTGDYRFINSDIGPSLLDPILSGTMRGNGLLTVSGSLISGNVIFDGDRDFSVSSSFLGGDVTLNGTTDTFLSYSTRGSVVAAVGASLAESVQRGTVSFVGVDHVDVTFGVRQPDTSYVLCMEANNHGAYVSAKTATGFTLTASGITTADIPYAIMRTLV